MRTAFRSSKPSSLAGPVGLELPFRRKRIKLVVMVMLILHGVLLVFGSAAIVNRYSNDQKAALDLANVQIDVLVERATRFSELEPSNSRVLERVRELTVDPRRLLVRVFGADGNLLFRSGQAFELKLPDIDVVASKGGRRMDLDRGQLTKWAPLGALGNVVMVDMDLAPVQAEARLRTLRDLAITGSTGLVGMFVLWFLLTIQLRELTAMVDQARGGPSKEPGWWASREVVEVHDAMQLLRQSKLDLWQLHEQMMTTLLAVSNAAPDAMLGCDERDRVVICNRAAEKLWADSSGVLVGQSLRSFLSPDGRAAFKAEMRVMRKAGAPADQNRTCETVLLSKDGKRVPMRVTLSMTELDGRPMLVLHCVDRSSEIDATRQLGAALAQARGANEAKSRFLATVSHEIRTPLNGLLGMHDLLARTVLDADQRGLADTAKACGRQLRKLLDDVLDLSKIEAGKLELENKPFDVQEQLGRAVRLYAASAEERGLELTVDWHTPQRMLLGDSFRIVQVLNNLIDNALKFTEKGSIAVEVHTELLPTDAESCELWVSVADTGPGIPPARMSRIFEVFTQQDETITRKFGGSGLGLSLCRQLCQAMGGNIAVAARPGGGAVFTFLVRCGAAHGMAPFQDTRPAEDAAVALLVGRRVLVVDDNRVNQTLLSRWLRQAGMEVTQAYDGAAGLSAVTAAPFDVILMDMSMPVMNGLEATAAVRALAQSDHEPRFATTPIIGISANAMAGDRDACFAAGMNAYVTKPIKRDELLTSIVGNLGPRKAAIDSQIDDEKLLNGI